MARAVRMRSDFATDVIAFVVAAGGSAERLREGAGIALSDLADPNRLIELERIGALMNTAARELGDDAFGLHLGAAIEPDSMGPFSYAVLNAPTVGVGLGNLARYLGALAQGTQSVFQVRGDVASLTVTLEGVDPDSIRHLTEAGGVVLLRLIRRLTGAVWRPLEVSFRHAQPRELSAYASLEADRIRFGRPKDEIRLSSHDLYAAVPGADRRLLPIAERQLEDVLSERAEPDAWLSEVEMLVGRRICDGHPSIRSIARQLGLSVRTFQRRLAERRVVYRDLVAGVRRQLARRYLEETPTELEEVAFLLGYSELSAFDRAFRRWVGCSPGEHRRAARGAGS